MALIGYGKMGKELEKAAIAQGHEVVLIVRSDNAKNVNLLELSHAEVAIEFSTPASVVSNIHTCFDAGIPVVVGTTGWYEQLPEIKERCERENHSFIYASNFSIGVNIFFEINKILAGIMNNQPAYDVSIQEIHHTHKLDAPSGTALTIAKDIIEKVKRKNSWVNADAGNITDHKNSANQISIHSIRTNDVVGTHSINYVSEADHLELKHVAHSRAGFVQGALAAAEWIADRKGFFTMQDFLQLES